jgi:hypothetical protein
VIGGDEPVWNRRHRSRCSILLNLQKYSSAVPSRLLKPLIRKTQPYGKSLAHRGIWVEPSLLAELEYRASPPRARCGIRFLRNCARIYDRPRAPSGGFFGRASRRSRNLISIHNGISSKSRSISTATRTRRHVRRKALLRKSRRAPAPHLNIRAEALLSRSKSRAGFRPRGKCQGVARHA